MPQLSPEIWLLLLGGALLASTLGAVTGFGGAALLLPLLVVAVGVRDAVPLLTVVQLVGNGSRAWLNRRAVDLRVVGWFSLGGIPLAILGATAFAHAPRDPLTRLLGAILLGIVAWRRLGPARTWRPALRDFAAIGAVSSLISALVGSVGPLMAPLFLAYGLVKGAYIGTEASATVVMHVTKLVVYGQAAVLTPEAVTTGVVLAPAMILGSWLGKRLVDRLPERTFTLVIEGTMTAAGLLFLVRGA